jgi:DNA-binding GntR family transcriptional regulator
MNASRKRNFDGISMIHKPIAPPALYQEVAERLRQRIFAHELAPGTWVDEQALAETYGISRTPLREALKVLASEGLVTLKPRRGCYVTEIFQRDLDDIFPILAILEGRCACDATRKLNPDGLKKLDSLHETLERAAAKGDIDGFFAANQTFHRTLQDLAGNRWLTHIIEDMRKVLKLARHHSLLREGRLEQSLAEHREIMTAIRARKPDLAEKIMVRHLLSGHEATTKLRADRLPAAIE